jgi:hypothetical protein
MTWSNPKIVDIKTKEFSLHSPDKARGTAQILHGDVTAEQIYFIQGSNVTKRCISYKYLP